MKFDETTRRAILRLKGPDTKRVTQGLREAAEQVAGFLASLSAGVGPLPGGYRAQLLRTISGLQWVLVRGDGNLRVAIVADEQLLWDSEGAVRVASQEHMRLFVQDVARGLVEVSGESLARIFTERLLGIQKLLGRDAEGIPLRRASDWTVDDMELSLV